MSKGLFADGRQAAVSLSFDDARASQVKVGLDVLAEHDLKASFYVQPGPVGQCIEGWRRAMAAGHEIGNHTIHHPCTGNFCWARAHALEDYTLDQMEAELLEANRRIEQILGVTPRTFAYPCGQTFVGRGVALKSYVPLVAGHFLAGRGYVGQVANAPEFCDLAQVCAFGSDGQSFESLRALIEDAIAGGTWVIFAGHEIGEDGTMTTSASALRELGAYLRGRAADVWVDTVAAVAEHIRDHR